MPVEFEDVMIESAEGFEAYGETFEAVEEALGNELEMWINIMEAKDIAAMEAEFGWPS